MNRLLSRKHTASLISTLVLSTSSFLLSGCAFTGGSAGGSNLDGGGLSGRGLMQGNVIGGQNPVEGALIQVYQIGQSSSSSYTANAKPLLSSTVLTDQYGGFSITSPINCAPGSYLYLTAAGGNPQAGGGSGVNNTSIALMASVGLCDNLSSATYIAVNEVTTVATAYVYAQFARTSLFGTSLASQSASATTPAFNIATSSTNLQGIANAAAMYGVLTAPDGSSPGGNGNGVWNNPLTLSGNTASGATGAIAEFWQINTIADILAACVNTSGTTGSGDTTSNCAVLFANVMPFNGVAPADTAQAALALALTPTVPTAQIANLYALIPPTAPFLPYVLPNAAAITDFTVAVQVKPTVPGTSTELLFEESWVGIDSKGNAWVTNQSFTNGTNHPANLLELSPIGVPMKAGTATGNTAANYLINSYTMNGTPATMVGQYQVKSDGVTYVAVGTLQAAIDTTDNVWMNDRGGDAVMKITGSAAGSTHNGGNAGDPGGSGALGYPLATSSAPMVTFVDGSNNVWSTLTGYSQGVALASPTKGVCGTNYAYQTGLVGFLGGDPTNGAYSPTSSQVNYFAIDPNVGDTTTVSATTTPIPGAPFIWSSATNNVINHQYTTGSTPGCATPLSAFSGSVASTTKVTGQTIATNDIAYPIGTNTYDLGFDSHGNLWIARPGTIDVATPPATATVPVALVKMTPNYGNAFTAAQAGSSTTFSYYTGGGMSTTYGPRLISIDGDGDVWIPPTSGSGLLEFDNNGVALSPAVITAAGPGFRGSTCTNCKFRGGLGITYIRNQNAKPGKVAIDISGNVWAPMGGTGAASIVVLVGAGAPTVSPIALGLKNKTLATRP